MENVDYGRYPNETVQKVWIRLYLEEKVKLRGKSSVSTVMERERGRGRVREREREREREVSQVSLP